MTRRLVICEKPSVAADVAKALGTTEKFAKTPWGFESSGYLVAAAAGHLVAELPPERYDEKYKVWSFEDLPILPERFMYQARDQRAASRLQQISALIRRDDVTELVNACDAGREGELIFKLIVQFARMQPAKPILRAWFSSMTAQAIQAAFAALKPDREMWPLEAAARCRSEADWLVGMNATRAATTTLGGRRQLLSMGRVQTPTLALIVRRDVEIDEFVPTDYFTLEATFDGLDAQTGSSATYVGVWRASREPQGADRFADKASADETADRVRTAGRGRVAAVEVRQEDVAAPKLFDLTDLQREANKRYGLTATKTLEAAQTCYEKHKVLSYPRTDSRYLTSDMASLIPGLVARVRAADPAYAPIADAVTAAQVDVSRIINDAKVNDHHGLAPTDAAHDLSQLSPDERKIYDLVVRRFLAALLPSQQLERTVIWTEVPTATTTEQFRTSGRRVIAPGWRLAWPEGGQKGAANSTDTDGDDAEESDSDVPDLPVDQAVTVASASVTARQTKPPAHYTEATLLGAMATAGRLVSDDEMADAMKESGLGTPATRASIVERLVKVEYLERKKRQLRATAKGRGLVLSLGEHPLASPDLTGDWERRLRLIERGDPSRADAMRSSFSTDVRDFTRQISDGFAGCTADQMLVGRTVLAPCPVSTCDGNIVEGRKAWGCDSYKSKEETGCGFLVWKEQSGRRRTEKDLRKRIEEVLAGAEVTPLRTEKIVIGACPSEGCDGEIVERAKSWGCTSWRSPKETGCGYVIWRTNPDGTAVTSDEAVAMLAEGRSNARPKPAAFAPCPRCSGEILDRGKFYGCNSWQSPRKQGCRTQVWKTQSGSLISEEEARRQLAEMAGTPAPPARRAKRK